MAQCRENSICKTKAGWGYRHLVTFICFMCFFLINGQRTSFAITIVAMINHTSIETPKEYNSTHTFCPVIQNSTTSSKLKLQGAMNWSSDVQGFIFGASFFGLFIAFLPGSKLIEFFQARRVTFYGALLSSLATGITPLAARLDVSAMVIAQFVRGFGQGILTTGVFVVMANWFPRCERGVLTSVAFAGYTMGAILTSVVSGLMCDDPRLGWESVFYLYGGISLLITFFIFMTLCETPSDHPSISANELTYISENQAQSSSKILSPPWSKIFSSSSTYALIIAIFGQYWVYAYFWSVNTTFLGTVQHFPIEENGYISASLYFAKTIGEYSASALADWLLMKEYMAVTVLRKLCNTLGCVGISAAMLGIYFTGCNGFLVAIFSIIVMFFAGVATPGAWIAYMDMSIKYAGTLCGIMQTGGSTASFIVPVVVGYLTPNESLSEWHTVFFLTIAVVLASGIVFAVYGSAEVQAWNFEQSCNKTDSSVMEILKPNPKSNLRISQSD